MSFPINLNAGPVEIPSHLIFELLAFFVGYRYYNFLRKNTTDPINESNRVWIIIGAAGGALVFSRLLGVLENPAILANNILIAFANKTIVGGLLGGLFGVELVKKVIGEKHSSGDLFTLPLIVGMAIGRIGCFLSGVFDNTYGIETDLPWGMDLGDGKLRHPTNLYEIFFLIVLFFVIRNLSNQKKFQSGALFKIFMVSYLAFRLAIDFIKPAEYHLAGISPIQLSCLLGLVYYWKVIIFHKETLYA